jgi:Uma2 family endonuclease
MTATEFLAWYETQSEGRYELVDGAIVMMSPERARHVKAKYAIARALEDAIAKAGVDCTFYGDGIGVRIDGDNVRYPDAAINQGPAIDQDALLMDRPIVVVEIISPSSERSDTSDKLIDYFALPSVRHYLVVDAEKRKILHYFRGEDGKVAVHILSDGDISLDPPGLKFKVAKIFGPGRSG